MQFVLITPDYRCKTDICNPLSNAVQLPFTSGTSNRIENMSSTGTSFGPKAYQGFHTSYFGIHGGSQTK
jgi:hypothetical protein